MFPLWYRSCKRQISSMCLLKQRHRRYLPLARLAPYMGTTKNRIFINAFFKSQFNNWPLMRMCCYRSLNTKIDRLHEWCLRIIYNDKKSNFNELVRDGSASIHHQNLQKLAVEMFKVSICPEIVNELFQFINELFQFKEQISYWIKAKVSV